MTEAVATRVARGFRIWYAVAGGIGAWTVHLVGEAALVRLECDHPSVVWIMHALTVVTGLATLLAMFLAYDMMRGGRDDEGAGTPSGRTHFLGVFALIVGTLNLVLITTEGLYIAFIHAC